jgi:hypothetical protein
VKAKYLVLSLLFFVAMPYTHAQVVSFKDTIAAYNDARISINKKGMKVLGAWGLVNIAGGGIGYFVGKNDEGRYFGEMNALWGVVNTGISAMGLAGARREMDAKLNYKQSYDRYRANKKLYLINAGLDVLYIGTGLALNEYGNNAGRDQAIYKGFGKSIAVQGIFLLLFDNFMFASHQRYNSRWYQILNEIRVTNTGIGFSHTF